MSALGLGLIAAFCWGLHDITIRYLSRTVPLLAALLLVLAVGALFQIGVVVLYGWGQGLAAQAIWLSLGAGLAFLTASLGLYYAFERGPVRLVAPVIAAYPILSLGFAALEGNPISIGQMLAVLAILAGVALVAALSDTEESQTPAAGPTIALATLSAVGFACTFKLGQMAAEISGELPTTLITRLTALGLVAAIILYKRAPVMPGRSAIIPLAVMGFLDGIALLSVMSAARLPNPEYAAVASSIFGLLTIVLAWAFLHERMRRLQWMGCGIAFAGIGYLAL